jgi:hypothetical protein
MAYASLKVSEEAKRDLDLLQAEILTELGERVTQQELLARLIRLGRREKLRLVEWRPLSDTEWEAVARLPVATKDSRGEAHIDEDVYGGAA